jgi:hypothetical protein
MKDIGDVHSSSTAGKKGSSYRRHKTVQSVTGLTIMATHPKGFALMTEDLRPRTTVDSTINGLDSRLAGGQSQRPRSAGGKASVHDRLGG